MAEGGGFDERDPLIPETKDNGDDDDGEENQNPFSSPSGSFTPGRDRLYMKTMQKEKSGMQKPDTSYAETSFGGTGRTSGRSVTTEQIERRLAALRDFNTGLLATKDVGGHEQLLSDPEKEIEIQKVKAFIKKEYPEADFDKLGEIRFARDLPPKSQLKLMDVVVVGPKGGQTKIIREDGSGLLKGFLGKDFVKNALGRKAIEIDNDNLREMEKENDELEKQKKEKEKEMKQKQDMANQIKTTKNKMEVKRNQIRQFLETIDASEDKDGPLNEKEVDKYNQLIKADEKEHQELSKKLDGMRKAAKDLQKVKDDYQKITQKKTKLKETIEELQEKINTQDLEEKNQQIAEIKRQNEEDQAIIDDENASPSEKEAARARIAEREEELARLTTQIEERERAMPLRERVKEIFKKYGVTVTSILLAAGATIGAVIGAITNALKSMGKALGNGLKEIGKKTASLLPGLIGSIVSFLFKTAGQAIGFLAEHTWLLILAVVAFLVEGQIKKQR